MTTALTIFQGRAGDHNDLAIPGARSVGEHLGKLLDLTPVTIGIPEPALSTDWRTELNHALPTLHKLQRHFRKVVARGDKALSATSRCAVSLATLPVISALHEDVCIVWFDAHADLNTPVSTTSGYLGGLALSGPAGLWDSGLGAGTALEDIVLVGQRDLDPFEVDLIQSGKVCHIPPGAGLAEKLRQAIAGRPVYVHLDCDVLEPGIVPTDYVHPNGLDLEDLHSACEVLAEGEVVGLEIAEFQNSWGVDGSPVSPEPLIRSLLPILRKFGQLA